MARIYVDPTSGRSFAISRYGDLTPSEAGAVVGGEVAALAPQSDATRTILVGVATGALTFIVTRFLERWLK